MSRRIWIGLALVAAIALFAGGALYLRAPDEPAPAQSAHHRTIGQDFAAALDRASASPCGDAAHPGKAGACDRAKARGAAIPLPNAAELRDGLVTISGTVRDARTSGAVGNVEVVFRNAAGESTTTAGTDGKYRIQVAVGEYRAFVRDDTVLSVGRVDRVRLPGPPSSDVAGVPDDALMPVIVAHGDADGIDLAVTRGGTVRGRVHDRSGAPIKNAVVHARGPAGVRPTLGTDVAESDASGAFELRLPAGRYLLGASHPKFAGAEPDAGVVIAPGSSVSADLTLLAGCIITGRVLGPDGKPAGDGAIEKQWGSTDLQFAPAGKLGSDGTFRWMTIEEDSVTLRAWPWKAPPSAAQTFACRDGARFEDVKLVIPSRGADIEGVLVDHGGAPVPFAYIDLQPIDSGGISQQERTDADGKWGVFSMPAGRYRVTAHAPGRGIVSETVTSPQTGVKLALGGVGRLEGTTPLLATGSFELELRACLDGGAAVALPEDRRIVSVTGGRFSLDDVPACELQLTATWRGRSTTLHTRVVADGTAQLELGIGPPRGKTVHGIVRDEAGHPVEGAIVSARLNGDSGNANTASDANGAYTLRTYSGATLSASRRGQIAFGHVGMANVDDEQVDLVLAEDHHGPPPPTDDDSDDDRSVN